MGWVYLDVNGRLNSLKREERAVKKELRSYRKTLNKIKKLEKTIKAAAENNVRKIVVAGGVAANSSLRKEMKDKADAKGITLYLPGMNLCIDNAAMIALAGYLHHKQGKRSGLDLNPKASMAL